MNSRADRSNGEEIGGNPTIGITESCVAPRWKAPIAWLITVHVVKCSVCCFFTSTVGVKAWAQIVIVPGFAIALPAVAVFTIGFAVPALGAADTVKVECYRTNCCKGK